MLDSPRKRICPSDRRVACSNKRRHPVGLKKGSNPSSTSISAQAASSRSQKPALTGRYFFAGAAAAGADDELRIARKNSLLGSSTITSPLLRKLAR
jgi:hypothetical protein